MPKKPIKKPIKEPKREAKKNTIIDTAFRVWGESYFFNTSLASLAEAMNISKPAIYRYFSSKGNLLDAMEKSFFQKYYSIYNNIGNYLEPLDPLYPLDNSEINSDNEYFNENARHTKERFAEVLKAYNKCVVQFLAENSFFYRFFIFYILTNPRWEEEMQEKVRIIHRKYLKPALFNAEYGWKDEEEDIVIRFILSTSFFLLETMQEAGPESIIAENQQFIMSGFAKAIDGIDWKNLEQCALLQPEDVLPKDRIFSVIAQVVAQEGIWEASVDKIAKKLGMSKSSLYFYFKNRDDMLRQMVNREKEQIGKLFIARLPQAKKFSEVIYLYFLVVTYYVRMNPDFVTTLDWLRFQRINVEISPDNEENIAAFFPFLPEAQVKGECRFVEESLLQTFQWFNFLLIQEINQSIKDKENIAQTHWRIRCLHRLVLNGVTRRGIC